eukprot:TRINITY_DN6899_c0_g1_i1.p1 TRINITY_DN6899_c0_g1~~TRINITY_DN6899_c0_g1_i1.p1  ORF type:complete len:114 (-),score=5.95 TRINITY_DN6899_c0_g1_i1:72-392(-)
MARRFERHHNEEGLNLTRNEPPVGAGLEALRNTNRAGYHNSMPRRTTCKRGKGDCQNATLIMHWQASSGGPLTAAGPFSERHAFAIGNPLHISCKPCTSEPLDSYW